MNERAPELAAAAVPARVAPPARPSRSGLVEIDQGGSLTPLQWIERKMLSRPLIGPLAVLVIATIVFSIVSPNFGTLQNISLILQQVQVIAMLGIAQTLVILTAGIDLSVAAVMLLSHVATGNCAVRRHSPRARARFSALHRRRVRSHQRRPRHPVPHPALYRDPRHPQHLLLP